MPIDKTVSFPFFLCSNEKKKNVRIIIDYSFNMVNTAMWLPQKISDFDHRLYSLTLPVQNKRDDSPPGDMNGVRPQQD